MRNTSYSAPQVYAQPAARSALSGKLLLMTLFLPLAGYAQTAREVTGKVTDGTGTGLPGVTVLVTGTTVGTSTGADGGFSLQVPATATSLTVSFIGYAKQTVPIAGRNTVTVKLQDDAQALTDVVVVGYGTVKKSDLTGAVSALGPKEFNKGTFTSPDQLIQGRASGVQVTQNSGQPGGAATIKIRGNSAVTGTGQPLYVVDGVPLDGRSARPGATTSLGDSPNSNPLNFLNPADIESIDVLKDASATAIYGSRAAYGVVIITTKKGKLGVARLDVNAGAGFSHIQRRIKVLNADQYRQAIPYYGAPATNDKGQNNDPLGAILRTAPLQNYTVALSGGNETGRYRLSLGYLDQQGIVQKTGFKKYSANFSTNLTFLENKRLGADINIVTSQFREQLAPITNNGDFRGSLIGQALQWNPTDSLYRTDGLPTVRIGSSQINPVAQLQYYNDNSRVTTALASISPYYKIADWLTYRLLLSVNYSTGIRRQSIDQRLNINDYYGRGYAAILNSELTTQQATHTLTFNKNVIPDLNVNALVGYEFQQFENSGSNTNALGPPNGFGIYGLDYTNYIQYSNASARNISSFGDPISRLQSYFGRVALNYKQRYLLTATMRADGSTKFGTDNRYGYFPSVSAAWDVSQESFFKFEAVNQFKVRAGYGRTGNQEFPAGSAVAQYGFLNNGALTPLTNENKRLKWQSDEQYDAGLDFGFFNNRVTLTADYFYKKTTGLLFPTTPIQPAAPSNTVTWQNLEGAIVNKGVELLASVSAVDNSQFGVNISANATFIRNNVSGLPAPIATGALNGQGLSGVTVESIQNGYPINSFFTRQYQGLDPTTGQAAYGENGSPTFYVGQPNPRTLLGLTTAFRFQKLSLSANFNGVFGNQIYNNTLNSVLNVGQILTGKNIALSNFEAPIKESTTNPLTASSRFIESGNYVKLNNVTLSYAFGDFGRYFKGASIYAIAQNLFVITNYTGFDPEVNTSKPVGTVPSAGIDYTGYPTARVFTFGVNFSL